MGSERIAMKLSTLVLAASSCCTASKVTINSENEFVFNGSKLFLSGANHAWHWYGFDFGDGNFSKAPGQAYRDNVDRVADNGGNVMRVWLHTVGEGPSPKWGAFGSVDGTDEQNTMIDELKEALDYAETKNVLVILCLWDGASTKMTQRLVDLFWDESKLDSYINNALVPMATALKTHKALLAWEIVNEPEGVVHNNKVNNDQPCFDTQKLASSGAGWAEKWIPMKKILKFIGKQAAAIRRIGGNEAMVTSSTWNHIALGYYTDDCLMAASGDSMAKLDFFKLHTYCHGDCLSWPTGSPMTTGKSSFTDDKPLIMGEFSSSCSADNSIDEMYEHFYENNFDGALGWQLLDEGEGHCSDGRTVTASGIDHIGSRSDHGQIAVDLQDDKTDDAAETDKYNEEYCSLFENSVEVFMKSNQGKKIKTRGEKTVIYRVKLPKVSENSLYTGFFAFGKKNCGEDFIEQLGNGKIIVDILDKKAEYKIVGKYTGQTSNHFNTVFQFDNTHHKECNNCFGNKDSDQADLMLHFTGEVDFGTKSRDECLQSLRLGHLGKFENAEYNEADMTPCVSWLTKFW